MTARVMAPYLYFGGKGNMVQKIIPHIPPGQTYCEPFFGAGSIFWNIQPFPVEVINDLDGDVINLMRCLQNEDRARKLHHRLMFTLYSVEEFVLAIETLKTSDDPDARAWAFYVAKNQGFSGGATSPGDWSRAFTSCRDMAGNVSKYWTRFDALESWHKRLARVQIDCKPALEMIRYWDAPQTVFYLDPPYIANTRKSGGYAHEMTDDDHHALVDALLTVAGQFVLSGYPSPIYDRLDAICERVDYQTACHAAGRTRKSGLQGEGSAMAKVPRTEVLWVKRNKSGRLI